jgi:hypothetical protein
MSLPAILGVEDVMGRYGAKDRRTARRVMHEAGGFTVAGKLVVREDDLGRWEQRQAMTKRVTNPSPVSRPTRSRAAVAISPATGPDWWRPAA